jgi:hypothetical protein
MCIRSPFSGMGMPVRLENVVTVPREAESESLIDCCVKIIRNFLDPFLNEDRKESIVIGFNTFG